MTSLLDNFEVNRETRLFLSDGGSSLPPLVYLCCAEQLCVMNFSRIWLENGMARPVFQLLSDDRLCLGERAKEDIEKTAEVIKKGGKNSLLVSLSLP